MTKQEKENIKFYKQCQRLLTSIITHKKYESFANTLSNLEFSILTRVGNAESYLDLPNFDIIGMLQKIKQRMLSYN